LYCLNQSFDEFVGTARVVWRQLGWRTEPFEIFTVQQNTMMVDLLAALQDFLHFLQSQAPPLLAIEEQT
jgi:hypothetical protein